MGRLVAGAAARDDRVALLGDCQSHDPDPRVKERLQQLSGALRCDKNMADRTDYPKARLFILTTDNCVQTILGSKRVPRVRTPGEAAMMPQSSCPAAKQSPYRLPDGPCGSCRYRDARFRASHSVDRTDEFGHRLMRAPNWRKNDDFPLYAAQSKWRPPFMSITSPVMNPARGDARNETVWATS